MIDTHAHLDACDEEVSVLVRRARDAGVGRIVAVGSGIESCRQTIAICEREAGVFAALGIHPHQAGVEADRVEELRGLLAHGHAAAVGETGLDYYRDYAPRQAQLRLFEAQLALAAELGKPVVVHTRAASQDTARALERFEGVVVLHCFSALDLLPVALERGYYVSFAGNVTYPKAADLRAAAEHVPADRLLVETDSPYLAPQARRSRPNEPANVVHVIGALAAARGEERGRLSAQIDANAAAAFSLP